MVRFHIQALERAGLKGRFRAGRFFPSHEPVTVIVHDRKDDPPYEGDPTMAHVPPFNVGTDSFEQIKGDKKLRIIPEGDPLNMESTEVQAMRARFDSAWEGLKESHAHELASERSRREDAEKYSAKLEAEQASLYEKLAALQTAAEEADKERNELRSELAELKGQREHETPVEAPHARRQGGTKGKEGSHRG